MTDLDLALTDLGRHVAWAEADLTLAVERRLADPPARRGSRRIVVAVAAALAVVVASAVSPIRTAIADLLDFGVVQVVEVPQLPAEVMETADMGRAVTLAEAVDTVGFEPLLPEPLGPPDEVHLPPEGGVALVWRAEGVVVTQHRGALVDVRKYVEDDTQVQPTLVDGRPALWIEGGHAVAFVDEGGQRVEAEPRFASSTLVWEEGDLVVRVETTGTRDHAHQVAEAISRG